jgi:hypothetical protein
MPGKKRVAPRTSLFAPFCLLILTAPALAAEVTLQWDANTESDLAGYKVYIGTASGVYGAPMVIGKLTTYTFANLPAGTYYFAVTAYDTAGFESGYSNEVTTAVAGTSKCDLGGDGIVNVLDLQRLINGILGVQPLTGGAGDLNGDGVVNVLDLQLLGNVILGLRSCPS